MKADYQYIVLMLNENIMMARVDLYDSPDVRRNHVGYYLKGFK